MITIKDIKEKIDALRIADAPLTEAMHEAVSGLVCKLTPDEDSTDWPDDDWDYAFTGRFLLHHGRYSYGKDNQSRTAEENKALAMTFAKKDTGPAEECRSVYMYDHSGCVCSFGPFADKCDSGLLGWWVLDRARLKKMGLKLNRRDSRHPQVQGWAEQDMKLLNQWLENDIWDVRVEWDDGSGEYPAPDIVSEADVSDHGCGGMWGRDYAEGEAKDYLLAAVKDVCEAVYQSETESGKSLQAAFERNNPPIPGLLEQVAV